MRHSFAGTASFFVSRYGLTARILSQNGAMSTTRSFITGRLPIGETVITWPASTNLRIGTLQASAAPPSMRMPQEPQTDMRHDLRYDSEPSWVSLMASSASSTVAVTGIVTVKVSNRDRLVSGS